MADAPLREAKQARHEDWLEAVEERQFHGRLRDFSTERLVPFMDEEKQRKRQEHQQLMEERWLREALVSRMFTIEETLDPDGVSQREARGTCNWAPTLVLSEEERVALEQELMQAMKQFYNV